MTHALTTKRRKIKDKDAPAGVSLSASSPKVLTPLVGALTPKPVPAPKRGDDVLVLPMDTRTPAMLGFLALALGFGGFLLWASYAPLDEGVPTPGIVAIDTKRKVVQHLSGGIIKAVHVKEGQIVHDGDPLMEIDPAATQANYEGARLRYYTMRAMEARLIAEQGERDTISFHPDLLEAQDSPQVADMIANQEGLFMARRMSLQAEIQAMEETAMGLEASITGYLGLLEARRSQLKLLQEEGRGLEGLVNEGLAPKNNLLALQRMSAEAMGAVSDLQGNVDRSRSALAEMKLRIIQRRQEYRKEVDRELADVRSQVEAEGDRFQALKSDLARTVIRAPASGQVVGLATQTVGGIIAPGQKIMDIVPGDEPLLLEAQIPPHLIDRVRPGFSADVRFSSFAHSPSLVVSGKVESISNDLLVNEQNGMAYYLARVSVTEEGMATLGKRQLQPGMPAEIIIITGERSMLTYLLHPLLKRVAASMKEE